ncbi:glycine-rich domain-containing protein [Pseudoduganella sp. UC29_106]|uniref:glycine-rich domain-containing protein n=1 Tax=Pseudoduganella sp. UC29_106 TaxID=3374553 RepID=UPI0037581A5B
MISSESFKAVADLDLEPIKVKLMHVESGEGWSLEKVNAVEFEYRRFLYLMKMFPNEQTAPLMDVDIFWHYHILDTMKYAVDCEKVFGYFLHHFPYIGLRGEDDEEAHERVGNRMKELYEETFGEAYLRSDTAYSGRVASAPDFSAKTAYSGRVSVAYSGRVAAQTAYSGRVAGEQVAYSGRVAGEQVAYSGRVAGQQVAYSGRVASEAKTAYSGRIAAEAKTAYSGRVAAQAQTAYSGRVAGEQVAYSGRVAGEKVAYSGRVAAEAKTAYSGRVSAEAQTAYSGRVSAEAKTAYSGRVGAPAAADTNNFYAERPRLATA